MASTSGRRVVVPMTNKSGGGVIAGDVVVIDTANNDSFTTTTSAASTASIGVAQETIANNAVGKVCIGGKVELVNVNASVTRGNYGATHTVAKQAADVGARAPGTFCQFTTSGTTPGAIIYPTDLGGTALTNPMTTAEDVIKGGVAGAPARLAKGAAGGALSVINGALAYNSGTSNPGSAVAGDRYWRTDLGMEFYYDGTRWLCTCPHRMQFAPLSALSPFAASTGLGYSELDNASLDLWITKIACSTTVITTNDGTNKWTVSFTRDPSATSLGSFSTGTTPDTAGTNTRHDIAVGALVGTSDRYISGLATKVAAPGTIYVLAAVYYRYVAP